MTVCLPDFKLSYVAIPKVACTSLKSMFFEVENDFAFRPFRSNGRSHWIHDLYPSREFEQLDRAAMEGHTRLTVVRDPIRRLLSCYANRVLYHRELSSEKAGPALARHDLPTDPDLTTFVHNLAGYSRAIGSIHHHARPMVDYIGRDPAWFSRIFPIADLEGFRKEVTRITGREVKMPWMQPSWPKVEASSLSPADIEALKHFYAEDYAAFGRYF